MPETVTTAQAAELLGKSVATINRMVLLGRITPHLKLPGKTGAYLFDRDQIESLRPAA